MKEGLERTFHTLVLDTIRRKGACQFTQDSLETVAVYDLMLNRWAVKVGLKLLAEDLGPDKVTKDVTMKIRVPDTWWDHFKMEHLGAWYLRLTRPVRYREVKKRALVTLYINRYRAFPEAEIADPGLGGPIRVVVPSDTFVKWTDTP